MPNCTFVTHTFTGQKNQPHEDPQALVQMFHGHLFLLLQLAHEGAPNQSRSHNANSKRECCQVEAAVHRSERSHAVLLIYEDGDVVLTAALRY